MSILVVAAHGDDEVLGCGGILSQMDCQKDILIMSASHVGEEKPRKVAERLGAGIVCGNFSDNKFDVYPMLVLTQFIELCQYKPDIIFTHYEHDMNIDHRLTYQAVMTAFRGQKVDIYSFEVPCSTEWAFKQFEPNVFVDIDRDKKIQLLKIYDNEMRKPPHPRSYKNIKGVERFKLIRKHSI